MPWPSAGGCGNGLNPNDTDSTTGKPSGSTASTANTSTTVPTSTNRTISSSSVSPSSSLSSITVAPSSASSILLTALPSPTAFGMRQSSSPVPSSRIHSDTNGSHQQHQHQRAGATLRGSSSSMLLHRNTSAGALSPRVPIRQTASSADVRGTRSFNVIQQPPLASSTTLPQTVKHAPAKLNTLLSASDQAPKKPTRTTVVKAAEPGKGTLLPDFYSRGSNDDLQSLNGSVSKSRRSARRRNDARREAPRSSKSASSLNMAFSAKPAVAAAGSKRQTSHTGVTSGTSQNSPVLPMHHVLNDVRPQTSSSKRSSKTGSTGSTSLRRRAGTSGTSSDDDEDGWMTSTSGRSSRSISNSNISNNNSSNTTGNNSRISPYRLSRARARRMSVFRWTNNFRMGHILQLCIVLAIGVLVWESHHKALFASQQLDQFKEEESMLLLHLQKIERHSILLHENLARLARAAKERQNGGEADGGDFFTNRQPVEGEDGNSGDINVDLIEKQKKQLYQMEEELNHEVKALEHRIQQSARAHIIQQFGEGPVQVNLDLDFSSIEADEANGQQQPLMNPLKKDPPKPTKISILLYHDAPHAAWTWLEQIGRHVWDGAEIAWSQAHVVDAIPTRNDPVASRIEFVEKGQHAHTAWTVGLRERTNEDGNSVGLAMYINLQDNTHYHKHETCIGIVNGPESFETLQRLLNVSRRNNYDTSGIKIQSASAMHVAQREM